MKNRAHALAILLAIAGVLIACNLPMASKKATATPTPKIKVSPIRPTIIPIITATPMPPTAQPTNTAKPNTPTATKAATSTPAPTLTPTRPPTPTKRPTPAWKKIVFARGAISWSGAVPPNGGFVFFALGGQSAEILVTTHDGKPANAALALSGADGSVYQTYNIGRPDWRGMLPKSQNYYIAIAAPNGTSGLKLTLTIYPPMRQRKEESNSQFGFVVDYDAKTAKKELPGYFENEIFGVRLTDNALYKNTNLQEAFFVISRENLRSRNACLNTRPDAGEVDDRGVWRVNAIDYRYYHTEEGAAGHFYKSELFRTYVRNTCLTVRLFTHETDIGNYASGTVKAYNRKRVLAELKRIFFTLRWP